MTASELLLHAEGLAKTYRLYARPVDRLLEALDPRNKPRHRAVEALKPLSMSLTRGEIVGVVGRNGSGKSTLLQMLAGTLNPTRGGYEKHGRLAAMLELGAGFNPDFTGLENLRLNAAILGMSPQELKEKEAQILAFANIGEAVHQPVRTYSSGMVVRLAFAVAMAMQPDFLIVDEALAVGDESFQRKCIERIRALRGEGAGVLFVSHNAGLVLDLCDRALLLEKGRLEAEGAPKMVMEAYHRLLYGAGGKMARSEPMPQALPESRVAYEASGAAIDAVALTDGEGRPVTVATRGGRYHVRYRLRFTEDADGVRCGMMLKTLGGIELGGATTGRPPHRPRAVKAGEAWEVDFSWRCLLAPGTYFINVGVSAETDEGRRFLHRITDALMLRVEPATAPGSATGLIDFSPEIHLTAQEPSPC